MEDISIPLERKEHQHRILLKAVPQQGLRITKCLCWLQESSVDWQHSQDNRLNTSNAVFQLPLTSLTPHAQHDRPSSPDPV